MVAGAAGDLSARSARSLQLLVALVLACCSFRRIRGRSLFRVIYFLPYIAPFVGTAAVFKILFSNRPTAPANNLLAAVGLPPLNWIDRPPRDFSP
jgi:ABC-type sugar transport system permease subunit